MSVKRYSLAEKAEMALLRAQGYKWRELGQWRGVSNHAAELQAKRGAAYAAACLVIVRDNRKYARRRARAALPDPWQWRRRALADARRKIDIDLVVDTMMEIPRRKYMRPLPARDLTNGYAAWTPGPEFAALCAQVDAHQRLGTTDTPEFEELLEMRRQAAMDGR
jgi:hypothetical protein